MTWDGFLPARRYASAAICYGISICLRVSRMLRIKSAKHLVEFFSPPDSPIILFRHWWLLLNSYGFNPNGDVEYKGVRKLGNVCPSPLIDNIWAMMFVSGGKRGDYQNCSVLYCVLKLCTVISTLRWAVLTVLWIGFCHTGPMSLCVDLCLSVCILCVFVSYCIYVVLLWARWGEPDGIEA